MQADTIKPYGWNLKSTYGLAFAQCEELSLRFLFRFDHTSTQLGSESIFRQQRYSKIDSDPN